MAEDFDEEEDPLEELELELLGPELEEELALLQGDKCAWLACPAGKKRVNPQSKMQSVRSPHGAVKAGAKTVVGGSDQWGARAQSRYVSKC